MPLSGLPFPVTLPLIEPVLAAAAALRLRLLAASARRNAACLAAMAAAGLTGLSITAGTCRAWPAETCTRAAFLRVAAPPDQVVW
jgi:hypothetical protein